MNDEHDDAGWGRAPATRIDALLDATNARFTRLRHRAASAGREPHAAVAASLASVDYIEAFWPHVTAAIAADPERLGLSIEGDDAAERVTARALRDAFLAHHAGAGDPAELAARAAVLSSLAIMSRLLSAATARWAEGFAAEPPRCPLAFELDAARYVSLRMLLPRRDRKGERVGANAPTLVMGGTATALTMCWNLLHQIPRAHRALTGAPPTRTQVEAVWRDTRELVFRIGSGSLAAFAALASACASEPSAMLWDGAAGLGLERDAGRFTWTLSPELVERYKSTLARIAPDQGGHYVGCAALYARSPALPLAEAWAEAPDREREPIVFNELLRWITAVARCQYFGVFEPGA